MNMNDKVLRLSTVVLFTGLLLISSYSLGQIVVDSAAIADHPRILMHRGMETDIKKEIENDPIWKNVHESILTQCDAIILREPLKRTMTGRRLLSQSREAFRRIFYLAYAWRMTEKKKYFKRCEEELIAVSKFSDWNPSHFLDVAEMTIGVAIGYDWLYENLTPKSREIISKAIIEKGLSPSLDTKYNGWLRGKNNWNQVCNAGITYGAIAVYEDQPEQSLQLINRAMQSILIPMKEYAPEGNYAEGYNYWGYGTTYNVLLINAIETLFHTDYGLSEQPGFLKTAAFYRNLMGNSGESFNYSDAQGPEPIQPAMFWFADKLKDPSLLYIEKDHLLQSNFSAGWNRFLPAALIWGHKVDIAEIKSPEEKAWFGHGENSIAVMRTSWEDTSGIYVGFKGGTPSVSHGHMDVGSFVMDAEGVRWSADLGWQPYESLESKGLDIWNMEQTSQRWQVFRLNNFSHSTLTVNNKLQNVNGNARIVTAADDSLFMRCVMDLTSVYSDDLADAKRGIAVVNKQYVTIRDELEAGDKECTVRWAMLTPANVTSIDGNQLQLTNKGKSLTLYVVNLPGVKLQTWRTDPPNNYDALNIGTVLVGFEMTIPANTKIDYNVILLPGDGNITIQRSALKPLSDW